MLFRSPLPRVPSLTLGSAEVTPLAMANGYATFAAHGLYCEPRSILEVRDRDQQRIPIPGEQCRQVLDRSVADSVTQLLTAVVDGPIAGRTGARMSLGNRPAAGKTGTTNDSAAVWFAGFTPQVAAAVWVGDPRGGFAYPMKDITINGQYYRQVFGGTLPGPIWKASMEAALADKPVEQFNLSTGLARSIFDVFKVPDLVGMYDMQAIIAALTEANLQLGDVLQVDGPELAGTVISQDPEAESPAIPESTVSIEVSTGQNTIPESRGAPLTDATTIMDRAGFTIEIIQVPEGSVPDGTVIDQSIPAGTIMPEIGRAHV